MRASKILSRLETVWLRKLIDSLPHPTMILEMRHAR